MSETAKALAAWRELNLRLRASGQHVLLGGGLGLYLLQSLRRSQLVVTLIPTTDWAELRATSDVDVFLPLSLLVDTAQFAAVRAGLAELGYEPTEENKFWQFRGTESGIVVDILTGPADDPRLKGDRRRVRPKGPKLGADFHAHPTLEALALEDELIELPAQSPDEGPSLIPGPATYLLMKLHTYADRSLPGDRRHDQHKSNEQAIDLYRIVAMMTEEEFERARRKLASLSEDPVVTKAVDIVAMSFSALDAPGLLALRGHPSGRLLPEPALGLFMIALAELFPRRTE